MFLPSSSRITKRAARAKTRKRPEVTLRSSVRGKVLQCLIIELFVPRLDGKEGKDSVSTTEELELELEALDIADEPLEIEGPDEAENEELAKKLLDEQGEIHQTQHHFVHTVQRL